MNSAMNVESSWAKNDALKILSPNRIIKSTAVMLRSER